MIDASLALQATIYNRLIARSDLTALVPAVNIRDAYGLPERMPGIIIGDGTTTYDDFKLFTYSDIHIWTDETGRTEVKKITAQVRAALSGRPWNVADHFCSDLRVTSVRFLRDPNKYAHGIISVKAILQERADA
jgi:hypothetical protein